MQPRPRLTNIKPRIAVADLTRAKLPPKQADSFYSSDEWRMLRITCLQRDGFRCAVAGCDERATFADHITRRRDGGGDELSNLRSLCRHHDAMLKERWDGSRSAAP